VSARASHRPPRITYAVALLCLFLLAGCGDHQKPAAHGLVPWTDEPATAGQLAQATTSPTCRVSALSLPRDEQQWGGVWNGAVSGYFMIANTGRRACDLPRPSRVTATTRPGTRISFDVRGPETPPTTLDPGDRVQVQVSSPYDCGKPLVQSTAFALSFPTGTLQVPGARMAVQCGGTLVDFSPRNAGSSGSASASATPTSQLRAKISQVPASVAPGDSVTYAVTLTNPTSSAISLDQCPSYQEGLKGRPSSVRTYQLNCGAVTRIPAHSSVGFAMQLPLPAELASGPAVLDWKLQLPSGPVDSGQFASADTRIE
jgi:hypothetical protein